MAHRRRASRTRTRARSGSEQRRGTSLLFINPPLYTRAIAYRGKRSTVNRFCDSDSSSFRAGNGFLDCR
jgi:hypothetical protein